MRCSPGGTLASAPLTGVITGVFSSTTQLSGRPDGLEYSDAGLETKEVYNIIVLKVSEGMQCESCTEDLKN